MTIADRIRERKKTTCAKCDAPLPVERHDRYCTDCRRVATRNWREKFRKAGARHVQLVR